jgi:hypothetical protein
VLPGTYTLKFTADGKSYTQTVTVKNDPRSPATLVALRAQHALQMKIMQGIEASYEASRIATGFRESLRGDTVAASLAFLARLDTVAGLDAQRGRGRAGGQAPAPNFRAINGALVSQLNTQEQGDMAPTTAALAAFAATCKELAAVTAAWQRITTTQLSAFNETLKQRGRTVLKAPTGVLKVPSCS